MNLPFDQLTYHSRRKNQPSGVLFYGNNEYEDFTYLDNGSKESTKRSNKQPPQTIASQSITKCSYLQNYENLIENIPSFSHLNTQEVTKQPLTIRDPSLDCNDKNKQFSYKVYEQLEQKSTERERNSLQQVQRQKIKTLTQHLKTALEANSQMDERYNSLKKKLQQTQTSTLNQLSTLKAEIIILTNQCHEKDAIIEQNNSVIQQLNNRLKLCQQNQSLMRQNFAIEMKRFQMENKMYQQLKEELIKNQLRDNQRRESMEKEIEQKTQYIQQLEQRIQNINYDIQHKHNFNQTQIITLEQQLKRVQKSLQETLTQNQLTKQQNNTLKKRITELNDNVTQICQNSQHLFAQLTLVQTKNQQLNQQLRQKQSHTMKLQQIHTQTNETINDLRCKLDTANQQHLILSEKYLSLQEENVNISKNNSSLMQEIELLNLQIKQLKDFIFIQNISSRPQTIKQNNLNNISNNYVKNILSKNKNNSTDDIQLKHSQKPTRDLDKRIRTEYVSQDTPTGCGAFETKRLQQNKSVADLISNRQSMRFNYLGDFQNNINEQNQHQQKKQPYTQYLSFQPSRPSSQHMKQSEAYNSKRQVSTSIDDRQPFNYEANLSKDYKDYNPYPYRSLTTNNPQTDRRAKSFYIDHHQNKPLHNNSYSSLLNETTEIQQRRSSLNSMRHSLEFKNKSLQLRKNSQAFLKSSTLNLKNSQLDKILSQHQLQQSNDTKNMFFSKLDKMKLWAKQTTSQNNTDRQPLSQLQQNYDYLKNKNLPIQTVIKQKSTILNQRKNHLSFNLNNQMIQKNILKLQKNSTTQSKSTLRTKQDTTTTLNLSKENNLSGLSPIYEQMSNDKNLASTIYQNCKKVLYHKDG